MCFALRTRPSKMVVGSKSRSSAGYLGFGPNRSKRSSSHIRLFLSCSVSGGGVGGRSFGLGPPADGQVNAAAEGEDSLASPLAIPEGSRRSDLLALCFFRLGGALGSSSFGCCDTDINRSKPCDYESLGCYALTFRLRCRRSTRSS